MKNLYFRLIFVLYFLNSTATAQNVTISPNGITPRPTHPRLTYDAILALPTPAEGDLAYDLTFKCLRVYNGNKWVCTLKNNPDLAPSHAAIVSAGGLNYDQAQSVAVDAAGNVYITGIYNGTATFGNTSISSKGYNDIFIAKYNGSGALAWVKSAGGTGDDYAINIAVDANGNFYITGRYTSDATFEASTITSTGSFDLFLAKYTSGGTLAWVKSAGGAQSDGGSDIVVDAGGNVYVTGYYAGVVFFEGTAVNGAGNNDFFVAKYNANGGLQWVRSAGGIYDDRGNGIALDAANNVYLTGQFQNSFTFGNTPLTSAGGYDIFIAKYNSDGVLQLVNSSGGPSDDYGLDIAVDNAGNSYITGGYQLNATFGSLSTISTGSTDIFIAKYSSEGSFQWVKSIGGADIDFGYGITIDSNGYIYVTGVYFNTLNLGSQSITSVAGSTDIFVIKYSNTGTFQWAQSSGGNSDDYGLAIAIDTIGTIYITGSYWGTATFGNTTKTSAGNSDVFIERIEK